jgi:predicted DNA-binding protein
MADKRSGNRKKEPKDQTILIRLSKSDRELLNKLSEEEDLPLAQIVRRAVKMYSNYYRP